MDHAEIVAAIYDGIFDGDLDAVATAIVNRTRIVGTEVRLIPGQTAWRLRYQGDEWTQESATMGELKFAEGHASIIDMSTGRAVRRQASMWDLDPNFNAEHAVALIVAHLHKAQGVELPDALKRAEAITAAEFAASVGEYKVAGAPKDDPTSEPPTTTTPTA